MPFLRIDTPSTTDRIAPSPVIWAPNHRSMFDTFLGLIALHRLDRTAAFFVTDRYFERPLIGRLLRRAGAIPVDPERPRELFTEGARCIDAGINLVIMAEGRLVPETERTGGIGELRPGVAVLAKRLGVPIQPVALIGADAVWAPGEHRPAFSILRRQRLTVRFGEPIPSTGRSRELLARLQTSLSSLVQHSEAGHDRAVASTPSLLHRPAAVDGDGLAGHIGRGIARQQHESAVKFG